MSESSLSKDIGIRPARPADVHRLVALLPKGLILPVHTRYLVAERNPSGDFCGGAYLIFQPALGGGPSALFHYAVADEADEEVVGSLLLRASIVQARFLGAQALVFDRMVSEGTPMENLLKAHSFSPVQMLTEYEMDCPSGFKACDSVRRALERKGKIPAEARVLPLSSAPSHPVGQLVSRYLGPVSDLNWRSPHLGVLGDISTVVQLGQRVVGVVIVREVEGEAEAPYDVVDEEFRNSWVTPLLWGRAFKEGLEAGYQTVRFRTNEEQFKKFANFARRMKSKSLGRTIRYGLMLEG